MTGYGRAEVASPNGKFIIEIKSLNGKNCDVNMKTSILPRHKEMEVRKLLAERLYRGSIDLFITEESSGETSSKRINSELLSAYFTQLTNIYENTSNKGLKKLIENSQNEPILLETLMRLPDIIDNKKEEMSEEACNQLIEGIKLAIQSIDEFRLQEGEVLKQDISSRIAKILDYMDKVETYEAERIDAVKERLNSKIQDLDIKIDENRLEQEIIFYVEKLDINEEKVRLRQHCKYFIEILENDPNPGKKLGFVGQEIGREINTTGSKANHAEIQKLVVGMKEELEKIKEQSLNIL